MFFENTEYDDHEIVNALLERNGSVTREFFYRKCYPLFKSVFDNYHTDCDSCVEFMNDIYLHILTPDADTGLCKLEKFKFESTLYQWLKTTAIRFCLKLKTDGIVIDDESQEPLDNRNRHTDSTESSQAKMDVDNLLCQMKNQRYAKVIRMLMIEDMTPDEVAKELFVTVDNLYNIKRRAMAALAKVALKDKRHYER